MILVWTQHFIQRLLNECKQISFCKLLKKNLACSDTVHAPKISKSYNKRKLFQVSVPFVGNCRSPPGKPVVNPYLQKRHTKTQNEAQTFLLNLKHTHVYLYLLHTYTDPYNIRITTPDRPRKRRNFFGTNGYSQRFLTWKVHFFTSFFYIISNISVYWTDWFRVITDSNECCVMSVCPLVKTCP